MRDRFLIPVYLMKVKTRQCMLTTSGFVCLFISFGFPFKDDVFGISGLF